jgi:hypothetical protein
MNWREKLSRNISSLNSPSFREGQGFSCIFLQQVVFFGFTGSAGLAGRSLLNNNRLAASTKPVNPNRSIFLFRIQPVSKFDESNCVNVTVNLNNCHPRVKAILTNGAFIRINCGKPRLN